MTPETRVTGPVPAVAAAVEAPADWEDLLGATAAADYPHTRHWQRCAAGHRPGARQLWLSVRREGQLLGGLAAVAAPGRRVAGLVPLQQLDSSIEGTSGGPLVRDDLDPAGQDAVFLALVDAYLARRAAGAATATFALNPLAEARYGPLLRSRHAWVRRDSPTAMLSLAGGVEEVAARRLNNTKRNERNRGLRAGAEVFATRDPSLLAAYYPIYRDASAHWGIAPTPLGLLQDLLADPDDRVFFTCVRAGRQVIGGHLCLHLGRRVFAWNGVSDPAFARTHYPSTLCFWGDLIEACRRRADWLDLGASGGVQSLVGYKKYFGAELKERGYYVADTAAMKTLRRARRAWGRLRRGSPQRWHDESPGGGRR